MNCVNCRAVKVSINGIGNSLHGGSPKPMATCHLDGNGPNGAACLARPCDRGSSQPGRARLGRLSRAFLEDHRGEHHRGRDVTAHGRFGEAPFHSTILDCGS